MLLALVALAAIIAGLIHAAITAAGDGTSAPGSASPPSRPEGPPAPPAPRPAEVLPAGLSGRHAYAGLPRPEGYPHPLRTLTNLAYVVGYDDRRGNPAWAVYRLPGESLPQRFPRPTRFRTDNRTAARVGPEVYAKSGYDRGHLAPNHAIATRFGAAAQEETFLMSNVMPQTPELNQGPWRRVEATLADSTAVRSREIWVTVGPVYRGQPVSLQGKTLVPGACFLLVADELPRGGVRLQAILMPQRVSRQEEVARHVTSVDEVERATGLDFFSELPDELEAALELPAAPYWLED